MIEYLFAYGSLRWGATNPTARHLHGLASWMGIGRMPGRIYSLGDYPGAVLDENCGQWVEGDVFQLGDSQAVFRVLDPYEGIGDEFPQPHEYLRQRCPVYFHGEVLSCWVYLHNWQGSSL
jgi:gamma-glutamylcyclotransferase (GGCT)/AIG2-like uncharacterized protein YtfP